MTDLTIDSHISVFRSAKFEVLAVGRTIREAIAALARANQFFGVKDIKLEEPQKGAPPCQWMVGFTSDGTSMKAAGELVAGGVIVTWWK